MADAAHARLFTTGYTGKRPQDLKALVDRLGALLFDIRFSANSRVPRWRRDALEDLLGPRYRHVPELGNRNYQQRGEIRIASPERGLGLVLEAASPVVMMCACEDPESCHRRVVARMLEARGLAVVELSRWEEPRETPLLFT